MALMEWDATMSVGVEEIDAQHKTLISLINEAYEAIQKHDEHMMTDLIVKMADYATVHFTTEEGYMKENGYPNIEGHKFLHVKFTQEVEAFKKNQFERTNFSKIFVFLSRWLTQHIMEEDMQYVPYMPKETPQGE